MFLFFVGLFFVDVEFDDGVSSNRCRSGAHLRKVDSYVRIFNTGRGFGKARLRHVYWRFGDVLFFCSLESCVMRSCYGSSIPGS